MSSFKRIVLIAGVFLVFAATIGCEESVDAIVGTERPYTIWGFMNSGADTQLVRVFPITEDLSLDASTSIDARVYSTNLTTGEQREWTYRTVRFGEDRTGHVFWAPFRAQYEHTYRLEVIRSDGATSSVEVTVPPEVDVTVDTEGTGVTIPVRIEGNVPNLVGPKVTYNAINVPPAAAWPPGTPLHPPVLHPVTVSYDDELQRRRDAWELTINMVRDTSAIYQEYRAACLITPPQFSAPDIWLRSMEFSVVLADSSWNPPGGEFDPNVLSVPGAMSNVENGHGYFGAGEGIRVEWVPSVDARRSAGFQFDARCKMGPFDADECRNPPVPCFGDNGASGWEIWLR